MTIFCYHFFLKQTPTTKLLWKWTQVNAPLVAAIPKPFAPAVQSVQCISASVDKDIEEMAF